MHIAAICAQTGSGPRFSEAHRPHFPRSHRKKKSNPHKFQKQVVLPINLHPLSGMVGFEPTIVCMLLSLGAGPISKVSKNQIATRKSLERKFKPLYR
jgi:hypothetical protein